MHDFLRWYCAYGPQEASLLVLVKPATACDKVLGTWWKTPQDGL